MKISSHRAGWGAAIGLIPLLALTGGPVSPATAAECVPRAGTFLPGQWTGYGYQDLYAPLENLYMDASQEGAFTMDVDEGGAVEGALEITGGGNAASSDVIGSSTASWQLQADLLGSASNVIVQGTYTFAIDGVVDIGGDDVEGFSGGSEQDVEGSFAALEVDCTMAWGTFQGVGVGEDIAWIAHRGADYATARELSARFNAVISHAQAVLADPQPDPEEVDLAVRQAIALNDLVGQAGACGEMPQGYGIGTPAAAFARDTLANVLREFLLAGLDGAYQTGQIVRTVTLGLQAGLFDAPECGADASAREIRAELLALLHQVLAARASTISEERDPQEYATVVAALHQYGMTDLLEKLS